jgi:hypothetical protein
MRRWLERRRRKRRRVVAPRIHREFGPAFGYVPGERSVTGKWKALRG